MAAARRAPKPAPAPSRTGPSWAPAALLTASMLFAFRGALRQYFAQDDFFGLATVTGVVPRHHTLWRWVSIQGFMDALYPMLRDRAWSYHAVCLAIHALNTVFLCGLLSRRFSRPAALLGAAWAGLHPSLFTALYWISARSDLLTGTFALATIALASRHDRWRWLAAPAFALALCSKESVLLLPAIVIVLRYWNPRPPTEKSARQGTRDLLPATLGAVALAFLLYLVLVPRTGLPAAASAASPYAVDYGLPAMWNLLTYVGWTVDVAMLKPGLRFVDQPNPELFPLAIGTLVAAALLALWPRLRQRGCIVGVAAYLLLLAPVLPLRNHAYHYYLCVPLMGSAVAVAALADAIAEWSRSRGRASRGRGSTSLAASSGSAAWTLTAALALAMALNTARLTRQMEERPSPVFPGLRADPIIDRARIAERAITTLRQARIPSSTELVLIMRERIALIARRVRGSGEQPPPVEEVYPESNVRTALLDGLGVRALVPGVDSVRFAVALGQPTETRRHGIYAPTGEVEVYSIAGMDSLLRSDWVRKW